MSVHHGVAGEAGLQLEDFVEADCFGLGQFLLRQANHKLDRCVRVIFLVVVDESWRFVISLQHGLQHRLLIRLHTRKETESYTD